MTENRWRDQKVATFNRTTINEVLARLDIDAEIAARVVIDADGTVTIDVARDRGKVVSND